MDASCTLEHDVHVCLPCGVVSRTERAKHSHLNGARHHRRVEGASQPLRCPICEVFCGGPNVWKAHMNGKRHRAKAQAMGVSLQMEPEEGGGEVIGHVYCTVCENYVHEDSWNRHHLTRFHQMKLRFGAIRSALEEAAKDKHGVTVSAADGVDFGVLDSARRSKAAEIMLDIRTTVPLSTVELTEVRLTPKSLGRVSQSVHCSLIFRGADSNKVVLVFLSRIARILQSWCTGKIRRSSFHSAKTISEYMRIASS